MSGFRKNGWTTLSCLLLALAILATYWPATRNEFVNYDDDVYVTSNVHIQSGVSWDAARWALTARHAGNWHPLTWLSHMLDWQWFGPNPKGHHLTSVLLHVANSVLLLLLLQQLTGARWRSAFVAALFALHPLHVESVAWIAERKDVLSTFFGLLTIWAYAQYARKTRSARIQPPTANSRHPTFYYFLALLLFMLGLMSKPMLVTWPFVLLLLDWWPLGRFSSFGPRVSGSIPSSEPDSKLELRSSKPALRVIGRLAVEKLPFLALSASASVLTVWAQGVAVGGLHLPLYVRLENAAVSCFNYILQMFWPAGLAVLYPFSTQIEPWRLAAAVVLLCCLTWWATNSAERRPWLFTGWFWFLGTLVPVIGLVQVGLQSRADRYTYVPLIGLFVIIAWAGYEVAVRWRLRSALVASVALAMIVACMPITRAQVQHWRNSVTLFEQALRWTKNNFTAENNLGQALLERGDLDAAQKHLSEAVRIYPNYADALSNLGNVLVAQGRLDEGMECLRKALQLQPRDPVFHHNLGCAMAKKNQWNEAIDEFKTSLQLNPDAFNVRADLVRALMFQGRLAECRDVLSEGLKRQPGNIDAEFGLGVVLSAQRNFPDAVPHFQRVVQSRPDDPEARIRLGDAFAELGDVSQAQAHYAAAFSSATPEVLSFLTQHAEQLDAQGCAQAALVSFKSALHLDPNWIPARYSLALILARQGKTAEAEQQLQSTLQLAPDHWEAHHQLALLALSQGRLDPARLRLEEATRINPTNALLRFHLGLVLDQLQLAADAVEQYRQALTLNPVMPNVLNNLAWILASNPDPNIRNGPEAARLARQACELNQFQDPRLLSTLAAAYAENGQFNDAVSMAARATSMARAAGNEELVKANEMWSELYRKGRRAWETMPKSPEDAKPLNTN